MADPSLAYSAERCFVADEDLKDWQVVEESDDDDHLPLELAGRCPSCSHLTQSDFTSDVVGVAQAGAGAPDPAEWATRVVSCACGVGHPKPAAASAQADSYGQQASEAAVASCGRWWLMSIRVTASGDGPRFRAAYDESLLTAARALQGAVADESSRVRASAEKWIAGVTAVFGIFGLSSIALGKEGIGALPLPGRIVAGAVALLALIAAASAIFHSYRAAYGWPVITDVGNDEELRAWHKGRRLRLGKAADDLKDGVVWAMVALGSLATAIGLVLFWPAETTKPLVKVTRTDDSEVCGSLLDTTTSSQVRVKKADGAVAAFPAADVRAVKITKKCGA